MKRIVKVGLGMFFFLGMVLAGSPAMVFAEGATLTGKVLFEGTVPEPKPINFGAEKQCAAMHGDKMPVNEDLVVNPNHTVRGVLVYVKEGAAGEYPAPAEPVVIDQSGCVFAPHVAAVMARQKVTLKNSDPVLHNVRSSSKLNKAFNVAQPIQGMMTHKTFDQPEIGIKLKCDVHFWMTGVIHVLGHPFFAVTGDQGSFAIKNLPPGTYTIEVWHETLGAQTQQVTLTGTETQELNFTLAP